MSSQEATKELENQAWRIRQNQMQQQEERQTFRSNPHIPPEVESKIKSYLREDPWIFSRDVRDRLIKEGIYDKLNAPSLSAISQSMQRYTAYIQFRDESINDNHDPTTGDASSRPLQALEQLASRDTTGSSQVPKRHVHSVDQQQQQQNWFMQQHILMLQRQQQAALATPQQHQGQPQVPNVAQQQQQWFAQQQVLALQRELHLAAARQQAAAVAEDQQFTQLSVPPYRQWRSVKLPTLDELLKNKNRVQSTEEKSPVVGMNDEIDNVNAVGASVKPTNVQTNCQAKTQTDMFVWPSLEELFPTQRRMKSQMIKLMRTPSQTTDCSGAAESILASNTEKQEQPTDIDPSSKKISLKDETLMADLESKDQRQFRIEIGRRVDELSSAVEKLRLKTTHIESEKSRLEKDVRSLTSQLDQQSMNSPDSTRDGITPGAFKSSSENVPSLSRHEKALISIPTRSNSRRISPDESSFIKKEEEFSKKYYCLSKLSRENIAQEAEKIATDDKNNKKSLDERVDQLTASMEKMQKMLDRFVTLYEPEKLQTLVQREDEEKRKKETIATKNREDELKMEIESLKSQRDLEEIKSVREKLQWEAEREKLRKQLQHYESLSHKGQIDSLSTQIISEPSNDLPKWQDTTEDNTKIYMESFRKILKHYQETVWEVNPQNVRKSTIDRQYENHAPELESQTTIPPPCPIVEDHRRGHLRRRFMFLLARHSCENLDCSIIAFEKNMKHASKCTKGSKCNRNICKYAHTRIEHLKVGDDEGQCKLSQPHSYVDEDAVQGMMTILDSGCPRNRNGPFASTMKEAIVNMVAWQAVRYGMVGDHEKTVDMETPKLNEMIDGQSSDSSSDVEEASGWEIVKSESRREVLV